MEKLELKETHNTPGVLLDPHQHIIKFWGESRPEDAYEFFSPIKKWLNNYHSWIASVSSKKNKPTSIQIQCGFNIEYFNSTSAKWFKEIILELINIKKMNEKPDFKIDLKIYFMYQEQDEDMLEMINEFSKLVDYPILPVIKS